MKREAISATIDPRVLRQIEDAVDAANDGVEEYAKLRSRSSVLELAAREWLARRVRCTACMDLGCRRCPEQEVAR